MKETRDGVTVTILGKDFMVACPEDERAELVAAAGYLDVPQVVTVFFPCAESHTIGEPLVCQ